MPRVKVSPAWTLVCALVLLGFCLGACAAPTSTGSVPSTATSARATATASATAAPTLAPTPTNVPTGWSVFDTTHFAIAYPSTWTAQTNPQQDGSVLYLLASPDHQSVVEVTVQLQVPDPQIGSPYCLPASGDVQHTTLAGLPVAYLLSGEGLLNRSWTFANVQRTVFVLVTQDAQSANATQELDESVLTTFRPDDAAPWSC